MKQIIDIADSGKIMPPKATWFELSSAQDSSSTSCRNIVVDK